MNRKLLKRFICAFLSVLMLVCMMPATVISAATAEEIAAMDQATFKDYFTNIANAPATLEDRLATMELRYDGDDYKLYCDTALGTVAYYKVATNEWLFTNPWDATSVESGASVKPEILSQILLTFTDGEIETTYNSFNEAAARKQITVTNIKNGVRVEYALGERTARKLVPIQIESTAFEEKILAPLQKITEEEPDNSEAAEALRKINAFFDEKDYLGMIEDGEEERAEAYATQFPIMKEKNINIYWNTATTEKQLRELEGYIKTFCPDYTFEELDIDHEFVNYFEESDSPKVFQLALEYRVDENGLTVTLPANGIRFDEASYRVLNIQVLPYMGACYRTSEGYSFIPDGSGTLYELDATNPMPAAVRVYGDDYALSKEISTETSETYRMPVFGQVETVTKTTETVVNSEIVTETTSYDRGYLAIIEEGASLASIRANHLENRGYSNVIPSFILRPVDQSSAGNWEVYASRRYIDDYSIRYIMLSDDAKAEKAQLTSYYECSWMGMACAYRDYLSKNNESFKRLTAEDLSTDANGNAMIPLYIETFGCIDTVKKIMSMPVTVSVALTSFEEVAGMYDYLAEAGITNINFKLTGYANGGMYSDVPYKLKWEKAVGGKSGFKDLAAYAEEKGFGIYPDFDFVYTTQEDGGSKVNMKDNASRTIDNRYTTRRVYSATQQTMVSYYQMVLSPETYSKFYEKLGDKYLKYQNGATGISLSTLGDSLNSDYHEDETVLREEAKDYVTEALAYFQNQNYEIMLNGGNAYTWNYADHILNVPLDSSRYSSELNAVPFMGVVLHGYVEFAGSPLNTEGNLDYAILKAIENGASIYFVLSASNTELLKEDILLSQNYSVRYDIWQTRLIELYNELNSALADVQTLLITNHQILDGEENASQRVPDADELLADIAEEVEARKQEIAAKIEADKKAEIDAQYAHIQKVKAATISIKAYTDLMSSNYLKYFYSLRFAASNLTSISNSTLLSLWEDARYFGKLTPDDVKESFGKRFSQDILENIVNIRNQKSEAEAILVSAKQSYDALVASKGTEHQLCLESRAVLVTAVDEYMKLLQGYVGKSTLTFVEGGKDAYIDGSDATITALYAQLTDGVKIGADALVNDGVVATEDLLAYITEKDETVEAKYGDIGVENLYNAFINLLIEDGLYDPANPTASVLNIQAMMQSIQPEENEEPGEAPEEGDGTEGDGTEGDGTEGDGTEGDGTEGDGTEGDESAETIVPEAPKGKYTLDNDIVLVTYGELGVDVKSFILNFNDYAVQTTYNGVTYTIGAYDYVVINHQAQ